MDQLLLASNLILWVVVIALAITVLALARQIGVLYERVAPAGALMIGTGPGVGDTAPALSLASLDGEVVTVGAANTAGRSTLIFFLSPTCPVCDTLIPVLRSISQAESGWLDIIVASDGEPVEHVKFREQKDLGSFPYIVSTQLGVTYQVAKLPFAVLIDDQGIVRSKGLTNNREHLESMFEAQERGVASLQDYMAKRPTDTQARSDVA